MIDYIILEECETKEEFEEVHNLGIGERSAE